MRRIAGPQSGRLLITAETRGRGLVRTCTGKLQMQHTSGSPFQPYEAARKDNGGTVLVHLLTACTGSGSTQHHRPMYHPNPVAKLVLVGHCLSPAPISTTSSQALGMSSVGAAPRIGEHPRGHPRNPKQDSLARWPMPTYPPPLSAQLRGVAATCLTPHQR